MKKLLLGLTAGALALSAVTPAMAQTPKKTPVAALLIGGLIAAGTVAIIVSDDDEEPASP